MTPDWLAAVPESDRWRKTDAAALLPRLDAVRAWAGITRVADITRLDRIGLPVFQAVRPMGRALSVHQGKGRSEADARVSAIMEAIESAASETVAPNGPTCRFEMLAPGERFTDYRRYGEIEPERPFDIDASVRWHEAERFPEGGRVFVPFDVVSLDFTFDGDTPFARSSLGLGAGAGTDDATMAALFELVERDAQSYWLASGMAGQAKARVDLAGIGGWMQVLEAHLAAHGIGIAIYIVEGAARLPVVFCRIDDPGYAPSFLGAACRPDPDDALFRAFGEAAQSRLTVISGARDDIAPDEPGWIGARALGAPTGASIDWQRVRDAYAHRPGLDEICARLAEAGHDEMARCDLSPPCGGASVVRLIIPGLAGSPQCVR